MASGFKTAAMSCNTFCVARTGNANIIKSASCTASTGLLKPASINPRPIASLMVWLERVLATIVRARFFSRITRHKLEPINPKPIKATFSNKKLDSAVVCSPIKAPQPIQVFDLTLALKYLGSDYFLPANQ